MRFSNVGFVFNERKGFIKIVRLGHDEFNRYRDTVIELCDSIHQEKTIDLKNEV